MPREGAKEALRDREGKVWDVVTHEQRLALVGHETIVADIFVNQDESVVVSADWNGTVRACALRELDFNRAKQSAEATSCDMRGGVTKPNRHLHVFCAISTDAHRRLPNVVPNGPSRSFPHWRLIPATTVA